MGFGLNGIRLPVLGEGTPEFVFGGACALLGFVWLGPRLGLLVSSLTITALWPGKGFAAVVSLIYILEPWATWWLSKRLGSLMAASAVFWLTVGALVDRAAYGWGLGMPHPSLMLLLVKQLLNGFLNALIAEGTLGLVPARLRDLLSYDDAVATLRLYVFRRVLFVVLLPISILTIPYTSTIYEQRLNQVRADQLRTATNLRLDLETLVSARAETLTRFARVIEVGGGALRPDAQAIVQAFAREHGQFNGVGVLDRTGIIRAVVHDGQVAFDVIGGSAANRRYFLRARDGARSAGPQIVLGSQHGDSRAGAVVVMAAALLDARGAFDGVVYGLLPFDEISSMVHRAPVARGLSAIVFDSERTVVASSDDSLVPGTPITRRVPANLLQPLKADIVTYNPPPDGSTASRLGLDTRFAAFQPIPVTGWGLVIELPLEGQLQAVLAATYWVLVFVAAALVLVYGLAVFVTRQIARPLTAVSRIASEIVAGRFGGSTSLVDLASSRIEEMRGLGDNLLTMQDGLRQYHALSQARERESEERFSATFHQAAVGIGHLDVEGRWLRVNGRLGAILGRTPALLLGQPILTQLRDEDRAAMAAAFSSIETGTRQVERLESRFDLPGGGEAITQATVSLVRDPQGGGKYFILVLEDIAERKRLEQDLLEAQKMETVGRLAGGVAHDFNNMLTAIIGYSELLAPRLAGHAVAQGELQQIREAGDRAKRLTQQLLAFARRQVFEPQVIDVNDLIRRMEAMLRRVIGEQILLDTELEPSLPSVRADPGQIEQVLLNLVVNARDASPGGGRILISTRVPTARDREEHEANGNGGDWIEMSVTDSGTGMSEEVRAHIFEPFFTTKPQDKGTGLGLATCYGIIKQSGGSIHVDTEQGHGSRFRVWLPAVAATPERSTVAAQPSDARGGERILLVEDERVVATMAAAVLRRQGYSVEVAGNGVEALEAWARADGRFDLLVTDVVMPQMGGGELAARLWDVRPDLRVVFMSGYSFDAMPHPVQQGRGTAFIQKPFTPGALAETVRHRLDDSRSQAAGLPGTTDV